MKKVCAVAQIVGIVGIIVAVLIVHFSTPETRPNYTSAVFYVSLALIVVGRFLAGAFTPSDFTWKRTIIGAIILLAVAVAISLIYMRYLGQL